MDDNQLHAQKGEKMLNSVGFRLGRDDEYFADVCGDEDYQPSRRTETQGTPPLGVSPHLVYGVLGKTRDTAPGKDGTTAWVFREDAHSFTFALKHIMDHFLAQGRFSGCLEISKVIPSPKVATPWNLIDLRPIVITPNMSRIREKILIKSFVATNYEKKIEARQHGIRVGVSVKNAFRRLQINFRHFQPVRFD